MKCIGRHDRRDEDLDWEDEGNDPPGDPEAEYFRECSFCGATVWLCGDCRDRIFLCSRCFNAQKTWGKDEARRIGRRRERKREWQRRARRRVPRDRSQLELFEERWV